MKLKFERKNNLNIATTMKNIIEEELNMDDKKTKNILLNEALNNQYLSADKGNQMLLKDLYLKYMNTNDVLKRLFASCSDNPKECDINKRPLIQYAAKQAEGKAPDFNNSKYFIGLYDPTYLIRNLSYIIEELNDQIDAIEKQDMRRKLVLDLKREASTENKRILLEGLEIPDWDRWEILVELSKQIKSLMTQLTNNFQTLNFQDIYSIILNDWNLLSGIEYTYKVLMELQKLQRDEDYIDDKRGLRLAVCQAFPS